MQENHREQSQEASQVCSAYGSCGCFRHHVTAHVIFNPSKPQNFHLFSRLAPTPLSSCLKVFCSRVMRTSTSAVQICGNRRKRSPRNEDAFGYGKPCDIPAQALAALHVFPTLRPARAEAKALVVSPWGQHLHPGTPYTICIASQ